MQQPSNCDRILSMPRTFELKLPRHFSFRHTVESHGWYDLAPFEHEDGSMKLQYVFPKTAKDPAINALIRKDRSKLVVELSTAPRDMARIEKGVRHILRLDEDLSGFYRSLECDDRLS